MFSWLQKKAKKQVYLDYAAATPVRAEVLKEMIPFFSEQFANAGAIHQKGMEVKEVLGQARRELATTLRVRPSGIIFTGSGTESNNSAILGKIAALRKAGVLYTDMEVITSPIEHASILSVCDYLKEQGVVIKYVELDGDGIPVAASLEALLSPQTVLCAFGYVNSEIGVIAPIAKLARIIRTKEKAFGTDIHVHVDAAQAPLWLPCALDALLCDSLALDAGKCYGPKGMGVLALAHGVALEPIVHGGGQESGLRASTENIPLIVGGVRALVLAQKSHAERAARVALLRDAFFKLLQGIEGVVVNGSLTARVANNVHVSIPGVESEFAVVTLSGKGIACATKSACGGAKGDGSSVVRHIYGDSARATSTLRFTLGEETTLEELAYTTKILEEHASRTKLFVNILSKKL